MTLRNHLIVRRKGSERRGGRGFSREELKKAGVSLRQALRIGLPVDVRRRTAHDENVKLVKQRLRSLKTVKKHVSKRKKKA